MKTFRELINLVESAQTPVAEDLIDHNAPEPLAKHFAELYYNGLSPADEAKMAAHVYQQVVDGEMSIEQLKQHIAKLEKEQGVAEGQATRTCPQCDGSGEDTLDPTKSCRRCGGKGHIPMSPREQGVAEGQATAKMGLMSAMGSNDNNPADQRRAMAQQAVERLVTKR